MAVNHTTDQPPHPPGTRKYAAVTQTYSTAALDVPTATVSAPPAGGTGDAAGAWDTAGHRDAAIASINALIADVLALRKVVNTLVDALQDNGLLG